MLKSFFKALIEKFPTIALTYRNLRDQFDRRRPAIQTPWGFMLAGNEDMAKGRFEPVETKQVRDLLQEVDVFVNVGANIGYYCCHASSFGKKVVAVEPITRNLHYLMKNMRINGWEKDVEIYPVALGESSNILDIWGGGTGASLIKGWAGIPESYVTQVPILTLDRVLGSSLQGKRALILADVEGAEYMMLQGAVHALSNDSRPIWMIEISTTEHQPQGVQNNPDFEKTFKIFFDHGYRAFVASESGRELKEDDIKQIRDNNNETASHNFIFR